ncbi:MAG: NAD-dependent epimerase/dehydratase family protein, partial [Hyphomicrobiales bacterium]
MTIAIIGGTGFIGRAVAERVIARAMTPIVIARGQHPVDLPAGAVFEKADRMDSAALTAIFRRHAVDTVIDIFALGLLNTRAVFEAMAAIGGRYLLLSSV